MDRGTWRATVREIAELDVTEHMFHIKKKKNQKDSSGLPGGSEVKSPPANAGEMHSASDPGGLHMP